MTDAQKRFCDEYLIDLNATRAYKVAYPNCKKDETASAAGSRMLGNVKVQEYISKKQKEIEKRTEITQDKVIQELANVAFSNGTDFAQIVEKEYEENIYDKEGNCIGTKPKKYKCLELTNTKDLTEQQKSAIAGIKQTANGIEIKTNDKVKALELLGRHLGIFNDKLDVNVKEKEEKKNAISDILNQMQDVDDE